LSRSPRIRFDERNLGPEFGEHRRPITGAAADFERSIAGLHLRSLQKEAERTRREQLARGRAKRWQILVEIGEFGVGRRHERFSRHGQESRQHVDVGHVIGPELAIDHA
jgi:hypothetical protein